MRYEVQCQTIAPMPGSKFREYGVPEPREVYLFDVLICARMKASSVRQSHPAYSWRVWDTVTGAEVVG